jgi:hypothetical protein
MNRPDRLYDQYAGKAKAEMHRGSGWWPLQPYPVALEPPFEPFDRHGVNVWDCYINDWEQGWEGSALKRLVQQRVYELGQGILLPPHESDGWGKLVAIPVEQFPEDKTTIPRMEQLLLSLRRLRHPVAFEICGRGPEPEWDFKLSAKLMAQGKPVEPAIIGWSKGYTVAQFVAHETDAKLVQSQLLAHYPNSAVTLEGKVDDPHLEAHARVQEGDAYAATLALQVGHGFPLKVFSRLDPDPLGVVLAAFDHLDKEEWALLQIVFEPASESWAEVLEQAIRDPYQKKPFLEDRQVRLVRDKFSSPLFAVSVRIAAKRQYVFRQLLGWAEQFAAAPDQALVPNTAEWDDDGMPDYERNFTGTSLLSRWSYRPGLLLSLQELASLAHLPSESIVSERLRAVKSRTKAAAEVNPEAGSVVLGENVHRGESRVVRLGAERRAEHCYLAGATGTGKSTLLLNMMVQDIKAGHGIGLLDPHGDLVRAVMRQIPESRVDDVVLFDPADKEYPFALNILDAADDSERERIVDETVMALERYFPASWGPRLERILRFTLLTVLHAIPGATLADVEHMLTDEQFRGKVIAKTKDPRFLTFWNKQFKFMPKNAVDPVLNKLSTFLLSRTVRNIVCQRHAAINFDTLINNRKILLANLSTGLLTEKIAGTFGSFLVTKIVNAAFRRASIPESKRRSWYLYIDEFQAFMNLSVGFERILSETRKYKLVLAGLANQYIGQLSHQVKEAVFGNVGTVVAFRLGVDDAAAVAKQFAGFETDDILNLNRGEAIMRVGTAGSSFNLKTYAAPRTPDTNPTKQIMARCRREYGRPVAEVEAELGAPPKDDGTRYEEEGEPPPDPDEDDLVS